MPDVIAQVTIQAGRVPYPPGSVVTIEDSTEAERLVERGDAVWADEPAAVQPRGDGEEVDSGEELPEDFPARKELIRAGITTVEAVRAIKDFDEIKGIGQAKEEQILAYLEESDAEEDE